MCFAVEICRKASLTNFSSDIFGKQLYYADIV